MGILDEIIAKFRGQSSEPNFNVEPDGMPSAMKSKGLLDVGTVVPRKVEPFNVNTGLLSRLNTPVSASPGERPAKPYLKEFSRNELMDVIDSVDQVFPGARNLMEFTAFTESNFGKDPNTLRQWNDPSVPSGYYTGGVMQIDPIGFNDTKDTKAHPGLKDKYIKIKNEFGIDWPSVKYEQLIDPLYSAIAARLLYSNVPEAAPKNFDMNMANYWKTHFNKAGTTGTSATKALNNWKKMQKKVKKP